MAKTLADIDKELVTVVDKLTKLASDLDNMELDDGDSANQVMKRIRLVQAATVVVKEAR